MSHYRPLRMLLLVYEMLRLVRVVQFVPAADGVPLIAYIVPNAFFLLMAFFLLVQFSEYLPYLLLYIAGKIIVLVTFVSWGLFSFNFESIPLLFLIGDCVALIFGCLIQWKSKKD
ncbi:hypothetical protein FACS1894172_10270 [Spirochaetia bacterium]|nr:hypothetical protein FACS1894164_13010 [Spirochaetia bacterium]GHU32863.1 hypothetical protein FACS1894172_10270 [Spirochaetia bacterium]